MSGWYHFDVVPDPPNTIEDLTNAQLVVIGNEYTLDHNAYQAYVVVLNDPEFAEVQNLKYHVDWTYETLNRIQQYSAQLMNGQYEENTPPVDQTGLNTQLETLVDDPYINGLNTAKINWATTRMIEYSKADGSGDWAYYSAEVTS
jgi:hypothetical protein